MHLPALWCQDMVLETVNAATELATTEVVPAAESGQDVLHVETFGTKEEELPDVRPTEGSTDDPSTGWETASEAEASNSGTESVAGHSTLNASRAPVPSGTDVLPGASEGQVEPVISVNIDDDETCTGEDDSSSSTQRRYQLDDLGDQPFLCLMTLLPCRELFALRLASRMTLAGTAQEIQDRLKKLWFEALSPSKGAKEFKPLDHRAESADSNSSNEILVFLNIYDVTHYSGVQWINSLFANQYSPVKFGGIFHVGVQIGTKEWSYGYKAEGTGVFWTPPLYQAAHHFRESIRMEPTKLSQKEVSDIIAELEAEWTGPSYHVFRRNCCHFADSLCHRLGVGNCPEWTYRASKSLAWNSLESGGVKKKRD